LSSLFHCVLINPFFIKKNGYADANPNPALPLFAVEHWFSAAVPLRPAAAELIAYF
jgi:hypothetical protein